jgi:HEPN domain-containing protein
MCAAHPAWRTWVNRTNFQQLSSLRRREASVLLAASEYAGAYYLAGYAVECALKACVAKQIQRHDFPDRKFVSDAYTHKLESLLKLAGLATDLGREMATNRALELNWAIVRDWNEESRYELGTTENGARDLYSACTARGHGVLPWIRTRW